MMNQLCRLSTNNGDKADDNQDQSCFSVFVM